MYNFKGLALKTCAVAAFGLFSVQASAAVVSFDLNHEFSGATPPAGTAPWMTITLDDGDVAGSVDLTISNAGLILDEFVSGVYLNYDGVSAPTFTYSSGDMAQSTDFSIDTYKADGDGYFDILFSYDVSASGDRFGAGESSSYTITGAGITAADFNVFSSPTGADQGQSGGKGPFQAAAHVQGIGGLSDQCGIDEPGCSGWIAPIPVPAAVWLFASGLLGLVGVARRKRA